MLHVKFKKVHELAKLPKQGKQGDAAFDLSCVEDFTLSPGQTLAVSTGLVLADMPDFDSNRDSIFLQIVSRSGLASKGVFTLGGIIDTTYRGEIKVILHNGNQHKLYDSGMKMTNNLHFKAGDRIASMLIQKVVTNDSLDRVSFEESNDITETARGAGGFGSTGKQ
jgi:dUTP pyrophosphatase